MQQIIASLYTECKYLFWPYLCASCKLFLRSDILLCVTCERTIQPVVSVPLAITPSVRMHIYAVAAYQGAMKRLILAKGWHDERASIVLGTLLWQNTTLPYIPFDIIVPVPLHWKRFASRGYNQAHVMAERVSALSGKPVYDALTRVKSTIFQSQLDGEERKENVKEAFVLTKEHVENIRGKRLLVVDDLMTSGATLQAAAKGLLRGKPESILGAVAGRVI